MRFKIDRASLIVGSKFTVLALFYVVFEGNFPSTSPLGGGAYIWRGDLTEGCLRIYFASYVNSLFPRTSAPARVKGEVLIEGGLLIRETLINFSFQKRYFYFD